MCQVVTHSRRAMAQVEKNGLRGARKLRSSEWLCRVLELGETGTQQYIGYRIYIYIYIVDGVCGGTSGGRGRCIILYEGSMC